MKESKNRSKSRAWTAGTASDAYFVCRWCREAVTFIADIIFLVVRCIELLNLLLYIQVKRGLPKLHVLPHCVLLYTCVGKLDDPRTQFLEIVQYTCHSKQHSCDIPTFFSSVHMYMYITLTHVRCITMTYRLFKYEKLMQWDHDRILLPKYIKPLTNVKPDLYLQKTPWQKVHEHFSPDRRYITLLTRQKVVARGNIAAATPFSSMLESFCRQQFRSLTTRSNCWCSRTALLDLMW